MVDLWRTKQDGSIWEGNHNVLFRVKSTCFGVDFAYYSTLSAKTISKSDKIPTFEPNFKIENRRKIGL